MRFTRVVTSDSVPLDGVIFDPQDAPQGTIIMVHGAGSHFYQTLFQVFGSEFATHGYRAIAINTRGHDLGVYIPNDGTPVVLGGAAWERLDESAQDIDAFASLAQSLAGGAGYGPLVLLGHSLGAAKSAHYLSTTNDHRIHALVGCSGLGIRTRMRSRPAPPEERMHAVRQLVESGHGDQLLGPEYQPRKVSAQTWADWQAWFRAPHADASLISRIVVPILTVYGDGEGVEESDVKAIADTAVKSPRSDSYLVPHADHDYHGTEAVAARHIICWITDVFPRA